MKRLIFIRHGKAEEAVREISDYERSLTHRGKAASRLVAVKLAETGVGIDLFVASTAFRAIETALIFADVFQVNPAELKLERELYYYNDIEAMLFNLQMSNDDSNTIALFGHNPLFTDICDSLCGDGHQYLSTSTAVVISFQTDSWRDIGFGKGSREFVFRPDKEL